MPTAADATRFRFRISVRPETVAMDALGGQPSAQREGSAPQASWFAGLAVLTLGAVLLFVRLDYPLLEPDETRYAELPRLMVRSGDWLTPRLEGKPYNDKPPLVYWLVAAGYEVFGVERWVGRAVCAAAGWLTLLAVYLWANRHLGARAAFLACLALETMVGFLAFSRMLLLDSVLSCCVTAAVLAGHHAIHEERLRWRWWLFSAACCGLGMLAKGPVAAVLVFPCLLAYRWLDNSSCRWGLRPAAAFMALAAAISAPWYVAMLLTNESFASEHLWRHHVMRFLEPFHHRKPFWFYGPAWFVELLPWSAVALLALRCWRSWPGPVRLAACGGAWIFLFFSASSGKLPTYLLPMLPLNALVLGWTLARLGEEARADRWLFWAATCGVVLLAVVVAARGHVMMHLMNHDPHALDALGLAALPLAAAAFWPRLHAGARLAFLAAAAAALGGLAAWHTIPDHTNQAGRSDEGAAMVAQAEKAGLPAVAFRGAWHGVSFCRGGPEFYVFHQEDAGQLTAWLAARPAAFVLIRNEGNRLDELAKAIPASHVMAEVRTTEMVHGVTVRRRAAESP